MAETDLHEAIRGIIQAGQGTNPYAVVDELVGIYGKEWAEKQGAIRYRETLAREAQTVIGRHRREMQRALRDGRPLEQVDPMELEFWVPTKAGPIWKRIGDFTVEDHRLRLDWLRGHGLALLGQARWHENIAAMMVARGASKTDQIGELPELPHVGPPGHPRLELKAAS